MSRSFEDRQTLSSNLKVAIGVLLVAAAFWGYQTFGTATIAVTSDPVGAVVWVDGRQRGVTPLERLELDTGSHRLEVSHSHLKTYSEGLSLSRGDHLVRHVELKAGEGTFEFLSNPRGAWVEVDGERLSGSTPLKHTLASGPHVIRMGQEERRVVEETHTVKDGELKEVNFNLNIDPHGTLTITTSPRSAKVVFIGEEELEYQPKMRIPIGEHAIRVSRRGYVPQEFRYKVRYGDNLHTVRLERQYANLRVSATPADAEILVAYDDGGVTQRRPYQDNMRIPAGRVDVRARAIGYRTENKRIDMGGDGATVRFQLTRMQTKVGSVLSDKLKAGGEAPSMVVLPPGSFQMGDPNGSYSDKPVRTVTITQPFAMSKYEVSIAQYLAFTDATGYEVSAKVPIDQPDLAMGFVSHKDAVAYADWLSGQTGQKYRLPSEAEWEYAARAGSTTDYFFGDDPIEICKYANVADLAARERYRDWDVIRCDDGLVRPGPGGRYLPNAFGLHDMYGNVSEWVLDCGLPSYEDAPNDGSPAEEGAGCTSHGIRGGSWDSMAIEAKSAYRNTASNANDDRGIRLVREL